AELFNLRHSTLQNVIEQVFGFLKERFKIILTASNYKLEQQYNCMISCACIHNSNILWNGHSDQTFKQSEANLGNQPVQQKNDDVYPFQQLKNSRECKECDNWQDQIAEYLWKQYIATLQKRCI
ncbi:uncharacterized protein VP01_2326g3, partial [Puccinia sorghi]